MRPSGVHFAPCNRLFRKLALRRCKLRLTRIELAGGKLDEHLPRGIAVLTLDDETPVAQHRNDQNGTGMDDVFARREAAVRKSHRIATHVQELAVEHLLGGNLGLDEVRVVFHASSGSALTRGLHNPAPIIAVASPAARVHSTQSFATRKSV
jgi:hypothetical protein